MRTNRHLPGLNHVCSESINHKNLPAINHKCSLFVRVGARIGYKGGMNEILFSIGDLPIRLGMALTGFGILALALLLGIAVVIARSSGRSAELAQAQAIRAAELE